MQPEQQPEQQSPQGNEVPQVTPPTSPVEPHPAPKIVSATPKKKFPLWAKILIFTFGGLVTLAGLIILGFFLYASALIAPPIKVSDEFVNAVQANDTSAAYSLTSSEFKLATKEETLSTLFDRISPQLQGQEKISDKLYNVRNGVSTATIVYSIPSNQGTGYIKIVVRQKNDKWEVLSMLTSRKELKAKTN